MFTTKSEKGEDVQIKLENDQIIINDETLDISFENQLNGNFIIHHKGEALKAEVIEVDDAHKKFTIKIGNGFYYIDLKDQTDALLEKLGMTHLQNVVIKDIKAPMPGLILDIMVEVGQEVKKGDALMILEAMKMENVLKSSGEGTITSIEVTKGQSVEKNSVLIKF